MATDPEFSELLQRVRRGEESACTTLVNRYGNEIRRVIRIRLREPLLRSMVDTSDICQSVLIDFFTRMRLGEYQFDAPRDLVNLLLTMARHKLFNHGRHARVRRLIPQGNGTEVQFSLQQIAAQTESPSQQLIAEELIQKGFELLSEEEKQLARWRQEGLEWKEIAERLGEGPEAVRKRLTRAVDRVLVALGMKRDNE